LPDPQIPPVTFKVEVNYVEVNAVVMDQTGNFVRNLAKNDFQILEDGRPQAISTFALVDIPVERAERALFASQPIEPDVHSNAREFDGRLYILLLDDIHTNALRSVRVKAAAKRFIDRHLGANDLAAVVTTSGRSDASQNFTTNRRLLNQAVDRFMGRKLQSATLSTIQEALRAPLRAAGQRPGDPEEMERAYNARQALRSLKQLAEFMGGVRGRRKALIFISEGIDYDIYDVFGNRSASTILEDTRDAIGAATRANVSIYAVDARGLTSLGDEAIEIGSTVSDLPGLGTQSLQDELRRSQDSLRVVADETGGFATVNTNDFLASFQRIVDDNSSYYVLAYYPTNDRRDGKFRTIDVRVSRPGLVVRARKGYVAPRGRAPSVKPGDSVPGASVAMREVLDSPIQTRGLTMRVAPATFKGAAPNASIAMTVELVGPELTFQQRDGTFNDAIEVTFLFADADGKIKAADRTTLKLALKPDTHGVVTAGGLRVQMRAAVPPGKYQVRVGSREEQGRAGSVHFDLEVPDFTKAPLGMSDVVLTSTEASRLPTVAPDPDLKDLLPGPATTSRVFSRREELALLAEVYDNDTSRPHRVDVTTTITTDEGRVVYSRDEARDSSELKGARGGYGIVGRIPLDGLSPGLYVLKVAARSRLDSAPPVAREIQFRIAS
jgi:VWFA-related protein